MKGLVGTHLALENVRVVLCLLLRGVHAQPE